MTQSELDKKVNEVIAAITSLEQEAQAEYNRVFEKEAPPDSDIMTLMNIYANIGKLCRKALGNEIAQINVCASVLKDMSPKEVIPEAAQQEVAPETAPEAIKEVASAAPVAAPVAPAINSQPELPLFEKEENAIK